MLVFKQLLTIFKARCSIASNIISGGKIERDFLLVFSFNFERFLEKSDILVTMTNRKNLLEVLESML